MIGIKYTTHRVSFDFATKLLLFILSPFVAFLLSVRNAASKSSFAIFALWGMLFAWQMTIQTTSEYQDLIGIVERFENNTYTAEEVGHNIYAYFSFSSDAPKELYEIILIWFSKLFSSSYHIYYLLASFPFLFFMLGSLKKVTQEENFDNSLVCIVFLALFVMCKDIISLQNPRFSTGFWYIVYCTINYLDSNTRCNKFLFLLLLSPLFHSAYWVYILFFYLFTILPRRILKFEVIAIIVSPLLLINIDFLREYNVSFFPPAFEAWVERYLSDDNYNKFVIQTGRSGFWWVQAIFDSAIRIAYIFMTILLIRNKDTITKDHRNSVLYRFYILIYIFICIIQSVPILGQRYFDIIRVFCLILWLRTIMHKYPSILYYTLLTYSFFIIRRYCYVIGGALSVCTPIEFFVSPLPITLLRFFTL